nr:unnamed protein product [Callosobruchus analis]
MSSASYLIDSPRDQRYGQFLGEFTLDSVDSRCTDYNRTKMSLQLVLASLFPPTGQNVWENSLNWQPVPFNYWPVEEDHVIEDSKAKAAGKEYPGTKIFLYSAHESNVAALLRFLGLFYPHIYYQDYSSDKPKKLRIPHCGRICSLRKFESIFGHLLPTSEEECFKA